jgi:hypothetical protein
MNHVDQVKPEKKKKDIDMKDHKNKSPNKEIKYPEDMLVSQTNKVKRIP